MVTFTRAILVTDARGCRCRLGSTTQPQSGPTRSRLPLRPTQRAGRWPSGLAGTTNCVPTSHSRPTPRFLAHAHTSLVWVRSISTSMGNRSATTFSIRRRLCTRHLPVSHVLVCVAMQRGVLSWLASPALCCTTNTSHRVNQGKGCDRSGQGGLNLVL